MKKIVIMISLMLLFSYSVFPASKTVKVIREEETNDDIKLKSFLYNKLQGKWIKDNYISKETFDFINEIEESYYEGMHPDMYLNERITDILKVYRNNASLSLINSNVEEKKLNNIITDIFIRYTKDIFFGVTYKKYKDSDNVIQRDETMYYNKMMDSTKYGYSTFDINGLIGDFKPKIKLYYELSKLYRKLDKKEKNIDAKSTDSALDIVESTSELKKTLEVNMERLRKLQLEYPEKYILVNIPTYKLKIYNNEKVEMGMNVVVGKKDRRTPVLINTMRYFVVNPTWSIPETVIKKDVITAYLKDPEYFKKNKIKIYRDVETETPEVDPMTLKWEKENIKPLRGYKFVQDSNEKNALGKVKFLLENKQNIYLHDTQAKDLFKKQERMFSSGCVRLEQPIEMADYLFTEGKKGNKAYLKKVFEKNKDYYVGLPKPIKVYILYLTAYLNEDGRVEFLKDVYGKDMEMFFALSKLKKGSKREG